MACFSLCTHFFIKIKQFVERNFTLSHIKQIKEVCHRLRIISAAAATDHQWIVFCTVFCKQWDLSEV